MSNESRTPKKQMKPTHQFKGALRQDVAAWRYDPEASVPVWVFRNFHKLSSLPILTHRSGTEVRVGDWIVFCIEEEKMTVLTDDEFNQCFTALPPSTPAVVK